MLILDHLKLVRRDPVEVSRFRTFLLSTSTGRVEEVAVMHEKDDSCCRKEPWEVTASAIVAAVKGADGTILFAELDHRDEQ